MMGRSIKNRRHVDRGSPRLHHKTVTQAPTPPPTNTAPNPLKRLMQAAAQVGPTRPHDQVPRRGAEESHAVVRTSPTPRHGQVPRRATGAHPVGHTLRPTCCSLVRCAWS